MGVVGPIPGSGKIPLRRKWQPSLVFLPGKSHEQRSLAGYSLRGSQKAHNLVTKLQQLYHRME